ncbi:MAG: hypothetical protein R2797_13655 [Gelidibacter sp.]
MTKAFYIFSCLIVAHFNSFSQSSVNDYKYIIVPSQFEFLKERDQYQINSITKFLFNKYGYTAYMQDEELPEDLKNNKCLGLISDVVKDGGLFKTKLRIDLKDCNGNVIMSSQVGETREKEYAKAYNFALRDAFVTFQNMEYKYQPNETILSKAKPTLANTSEKEKEEIARLKEEIKTLKEEKKEEVAVTQPMAEIKKIEETKVESMPKETMATKTETKVSKSEVLYAQSIENGFQVVDSTPKVIMILYPTGAKDVFTVKDKNAIVFKKGEQWIYSENDGKEVKETPINIKF